MPLSVPDSVGDRAQLAREARHYGLPELEALAQVEMAKAQAQNSLIQELLEQREAEQQREEELATASAPTSLGPPLAFTDHHEKIQLSADGTKKRRKTPNLPLLPLLGSDSNSEIRR